MSGFSYVLEGRRFFSHRKIGDSCTSNEGDGFCMSRRKCPGIPTRSSCSDGGADGRDKFDIECCVIRQCTVSEGQGFCKSKKYDDCSGGKFHSGQGGSLPCPGSDDIQCCVKKADINSLNPVSNGTSSITPTSSTPSSQPSQSTVEPVSLDSGPKLSLSQIGGIAAGSVAAGIIISFLLIFFFMRRLRAKLNKKRREVTFFDNIFPPELPDSSGGSGRFVSNPLSTGGAASHTMRMTTDRYMEGGMISNDNSAYPTGPAFLVYDHNGERIGYQIPPAYRLYRPQVAVPIAELESSPSEAQTGKLWN